MVIENLSSNMEYILLFIQLIATIAAAVSAWQARNAALEMNKQRINEIRPVLKNHEFVYDKSQDDIICNVQCKGSGSMFNLQLIEPYESDVIQYEVALNTAMIKEYRIKPLPKGQVVFRYEDAFGNEYTSSCDVKNNALNGDYKQDLIKRVE